MAAGDSEKGRSEQKNMFMEAAITYGYIFLWIVLSAAVILINKFILAYTGFPYPIALTLTHMAFCSGLATLIIRAGLAETASMDSNTYMRCVLPIAALFSGTLWLGNAAYMYLSVSFIQMLKAMMPISVFSVGVMLGTERYQFSYASNMVLVAIGVAIASYGEINFNALGVFFQCGSIVTESFRLSLIQILLQSRGIKLNPVTTLYYIAPACFGFLLIPFTFLELPKIWSSADLQLRPGLLLLSASVAFALNMSVFLLIGRSSALTMNIAGVVKDWLLIGLSVMMYKSPVSGLQLGGYAISFLGVCWYNYQKVQGMKPSAPPPSRERDPLLGGQASSRA